MTEIRKLYVSTKVLAEAVCDKERLEALAFSLAVKLVFRSSVLLSANICEIRKFLKVGSKVASRVRKDGIAFGYLVPQRGGGLIAVPVRERNCFNVAITFERTKNEERQCLYSLKEIKDELRKAFLLNHISKQSDTVDTIKSATDGHTVREVRKARRKLKRMPPVSGCFETLSIDTISSLIHVCETKARRLKNQLVLSGDISEEEVIVETSIHIRDFDPKVENAMFRKANFAGCLLRRGGRVFCQLANAYRYNSSRVRYL